ncbi:ankyrin repeat domain-containing protein [Marinimicrobium sp. ARAG 43.8]|uniref:ankyrin repeat domain-containing protein n=1 Tax=Marinimicrobium sp. ARAG 43.8 TaxID=3418719 RepID=UPI003CFABDF9
MKLKCLAASALSIASAMLFAPTAFSGAIAETAEEALKRAIPQGNPAQVAEALETGVELNQPLPDGSLMLAWAVETQNPDLVRQLLAEGAKPDVGDSHLSSFSPLIVACQRGEPSIVMALLDAGAKVERSTADGVSPLALCAGHSDVQTVERLLAKGASADAVDDTGQTPLMWAAANARLDNAKHLIREGADINRVTHKGFSPLFFALRSGNPEMAELILDAGGDAEHRGPGDTTAIQMAMYQKQFRVADRLLSDETDLAAYDRNGDQLLHAAIKNDQLSLVAHLLAKGANPNALTGESKVVWRYEVNFTSRPYVSYARSPLLLAAEHSSAAMMRALIEAGADVDFVAEDGTNVVLAAAQNNPEALGFALTLVPDPNVTNQYGQTPLHLLMGYSNTLTNKQTGELFKQLASRGARTDIEDRWGQTPANMANDEQFRARAEFAEIFQTPKKVEL